MDLHRRRLVQRAFYFNSYVVNHPRSTSFPFIIMKPPIIIAWLCRGKCPVESVGKERDRERDNKVKDNTVEHYAMMKNEGD